MNSVPLQGDADNFVVDRMRLLSPRRQKHGELVPIQVRRPAHLMSPVLTSRKNPVDLMHEKYKKVIKQRHPTVMVCFLSRFEGFKIVEALSKILSS